MNSKFRFPAEWEPHSATWIAWPHEVSDWLEKFPAIRWVYTEIIRVLSESEKIHIVCHDEKVKKEAIESLNTVRVSASNCEFHICSNDRSWLRDSAPTAVIDSSGKLNWIGWTFNAWAKYDNYRRDQNIPALVSEITGAPLIRALREDTGKPFVLEGGAIETDGEGTLLVTEECLLSKVQERNPGLSQKDYEATFLKYLGIEKTIWLDRGCEGDDTHGHIDDIARFTAPGRVLLAFEENPSEEFYEASRENLARLTKAKDAKGRSLEVTKLPMPSPVFYEQDKAVYEHDRLPASYANFYIGTKTVLVPTFNDERDYEALSIIRKAFPGRKVVGINCSDLILGMGTFHCLTQQQPLA